MSKFEVYFEQVNQCRIIVKAKDKNEAIDKARKEWRRDHRDPSCGYATKLVDE